MSGIIDSRNSKISLSSFADSSIWHFVLSGWIRLDHFNFKRLYDIEMNIAALKRNNNICLREQLFDTQTNIAHYPVSIDLFASTLGSVLATKVSFCSNRISKQPILLTIFLVRIFLESQYWGGTKGVSSAVDLSIRTNLRREYVLEDRLASARCNHTLTLSFSRAWIVPVSIDWLGEPGGINLLIDAAYFGIRYEAKNSMGQSRVYEISEITQNSRARGNQLSIRGT